MTWVVLALFVAAIYAIAVGLRRATELFVVRVERGRVRVVRGRIPQRLLNDIADVMKKPQASGEIHCLVRDGSPRVEPKGDMTPQQVQRLRNTVSLWPIAKIKAAPPPR